MPKAYLLGPADKRRRKSAKSLKRERRGKNPVAKNPVAPASEQPQPLPHMRRLADVAGVNAVLKRARTPYDRDPLSEEEALNLICDAREAEPAYRMKNLYARLRQVAEEAHQPMITVLEKAVDEDRRTQFLRKANAAFARLR